MTRGRREEIYSNHQFHFSLALNIKNAESRGRGNAFYANPPEAPALCGNAFDQNRPLK